MLYNQDIFIIRKLVEKSLGKINHTIAQVMVRVFMHHFSINITTVFWMGHIIPCF